MSIESLLSEQVDFEALNLTNESLLDPADMVIAALEESLGFEEPTIATEVEAHQFHNQDHLDGMSDEEIANLDPDNTAHLNAAGQGSGMIVSPVTEGTILESLLSEEDEADLPAGLSDDDEDDLNDAELNLHDEDGFGYNP